MYAARLFTNLASAVTILAFLLSGNLVGWKYVAATVTVIWYGYVLSRDIREWRLEHSRSFRPKHAKIARYLCNWLGSGGNAAIFSRDMGWVDDESREVLLAKARQNELILCLPRPTVLSRALADAGAEVLLYPQLDYNPKSRFTIVNFDRGDARVSAGAVIRGTHVVREYDAGEDPFYWIAHDLINVVRRLSQQSGNGRGGLDRGVS